MKMFGPQDRTLRAADADRETVTQFLREQHLAGRLDTEEFQERIERSYAAKTYAELDALLADLPSGEPRTAGPGRDWRGPRFALLPLLILALVLSHGHLVWLAVPLAFCFVFRPMRRSAWAGGASWCGHGWSSASGSGTRAI
jgi:Domain of unknown function (DUF1707)